MRYTSAFSRSDRPAESSRKPMLLATPQAVRIWSVRVTLLPRYDRPPGNIGSPQSSAISIMRSYSPWTPSATARPDDGIDAIYGVLAQLLKRLLPLIDHRVRHAAEVDS